jgi:hypothetical protein
MLKKNSLFNNEAMPVISYLRKGGLLMWKSLPVVSRMRDNGEIMLMLIKHCSSESRLIVCKKTVDGWA